jgi:hypothetical protein
MHWCSVQHCTCVNSNTHAPHCLQKPLLCCTPAMCACHYVWPLQTSYQFKHDLQSSAKQVVDNRIALSATNRYCVLTLSIASFTGELVDCCFCSKRQGTAAVCKPAASLPCSYTQVERPCLRQKHYRSHPTSSKCWYKDSIQLQGMAC